VARFDVTNAEWALIEPFLPVAATGPLPRNVVLAEYPVRAGHAAWWYSCRVPPRRSRLRMSRCVIRSGSVRGAGSDEAAAVARRLAAPNDDDLSVEPDPTPCLDGHAILAIAPVGIADDVDARPGASTSAAFVRAGIEALGAARLPLREAKAVRSGARSVRTRALSGRGPLVGGPGCGALRVPVPDARRFLAGFGLGGAFPL
jgi:hypothetical protein